MARRTFDVIDICEIFTHWHAGRSKNEIAGSLGLSRNTVRKYVAAAEAAGMAPGGPAVSQQQWAELARGWFPELADTRLRQVTWPAIAGHRDYIVEQLEAGVTIATIHQRLRDERGLAVSVASLRRYVAAGGVVRRHVQHDLLFNAADRDAGHPHHAGHRPLRPLGGRLALRAGEGCKHGSGDTVALQLPEVGRLLPLPSSSVDRGTSSGHLVGQLGRGDDGDAIQRGRAHGPQRTGDPRGRRHPQTALRDVSPKLGQLEAGRAG